jgi:TnpA family transposase
MTADDQTRPASQAAPLLQRFSPRLRRVAHRVLWCVARPYARNRMRETEMAAALARLEADFKHVRERHDEQIERLEELAREFVLTAEALRRASAAHKDHGAS